MHDFLLNLDYRVFYFFNGFANQNRLLDIIFVIFAETIIFVLITGFIILLIRARSRWVQMTTPLISGLVGRFAFASLIRAYAFRPRPFVAGFVSQLVYHNPLEASFPSGHAAFMFGMTFSLLFLPVPRAWKIVSLVLASISAISRVIVGVHYPLDIFAGALVGLISAILVKWIFEIIFKKGYKN